MGGMRPSPFAGSPARHAWPVFVALLALAAIGLAVWSLERAATGLDIRSQWLGSTPVTVFRPAPSTGPSASAAAAASGPPPVVLIAHGFAGSQQLMLPFAITLARNGFVAITFDFPGHGRNAEPMRGGLSDPPESLRVLLASMNRLGDFARAQATASGGDGRYAVVGHSMASDIVVRHAQARTEVQATVGVSLFAPSILADTPLDQPRNLLVIDGALEPAMMAREALRVVGRGGVAAPAQATTYGRFEDGTARRATESPGVEHIAVLYSADTLAESLAWLQAAFGRAATPPPFIDRRGPWLGLLLIGVVVLAWPLSRALPILTTVSRAAAGGVKRMATVAEAGMATGTALAAPAGVPKRTRWWGWRGQAPLTLLPALLTPLLLWPLPSDFLPILLGDYLVMHFALYGLLTLAGLWALGQRPPRVERGRGAALVRAVLLTSAFAVLVIGAAVDRYVFNVVPEPGRLPLILAMCAGTLPYFLADEWLTRRPAAAPGAYFASKLAFLLSLVLAIALDPGRLFFLAIIVPAVLLLFLMYGLFSRWVFQRTGHPAVAAVANALAFGCFIAVTFPLVA